MGGLEREGFCVLVIIKRETLNSLNLPTQEEVFPPTYSAWAYYIVMFGLKGLVVSLWGLLLSCKRLGLLSCNDLAYYYVMIWVITIS